MVKIVYDRVKEMMDKRDISQKELAYRIGIYPTTLSKMMHGKLVIKNRLLAQMADVLDIVPEYLTGEIDEPTPAKKNLLFEGIKRGDHIIIWTTADEVVAGFVNGVEILLDNNFRPHPFMYLCDDEAGKINVLHLEEIQKINKL